MEINLKVKGQWFRPFFWKMGPNLKVISEIMPALQYVVKKCKPNCLPKFHIVFVSSEFHNSLWTFKKKKTTLDTKLFLNFKVLRFPALTERSYKNYVNNSFLKYLHIKKECMKKREILSKRPSINVIWTPSPHVTTFQYL